MRAAHYKVELDKRVDNRLKRSLFDVNTQLRHFAIITYRVPVEKIKHLIPKPFKLWTFSEGGREYALVSAVPFKDEDFCFHRIFQYPKFDFFQTNFRTYIIDERDGTNAAWFFGTTLGSFTALIPKNIWRMPWEYGKFKFEYETSGMGYSKYEMMFNSRQGDGVVDIKGAGTKMRLLDGFDSLEEQVLILTHPVIGYYQLPRYKIGTYEIWHPIMNLEHGIRNKLYFELFENLGFLSKPEMNNPHSILMTRQVEFDILLPPKTISLA